MLIIVDYDEPNLRARTLRHAACPWASPLHPLLPLKMYLLLHFNTCLFSDDIKLISVFFWFNVNVFNKTKLG